MTITYCTGDLFSSTCPALGHGVNALGRMGAGIAVEFRWRWPAMYAAYQEACRSGRLQPGGIFVYEAPDRLIISMATQRGIGRGSARLEWVRVRTAGSAAATRGAGASAHCRGPGRSGVRTGR